MGSAVSWSATLLLSLPLLVEANSCWNPLYALYWAGKSDIRHLASRPELQFALNRCIFYNGLEACCPLAFEEEQQRAFQSWEEHWEGKVQRVRQFKLAMEELKVSDAFLQADYAEQGRFRESLGAFDAVLDSYGTCFATLLEYIAGMLCFPCDPDWRNKLFMEGVQVRYLRVHESTHEALWAACEKLGAAARELRVRLQDSSLVKMVASPYEDLEMFETKIGVSEYMAYHGLYAMRGPTERMRHKEVQVSRALLAQDDDDKNHGGHRSLETSLHPVRDGRASGFNCSIFPREPANTAAGKSWPVVLWLLWLVLGERAVISALRRQAGSR